MPWMEDSASHLQNLHISRPRGEAYGNAAPNHPNESTNVYRISSNERFKAEICIL